MNIILPAGTVKQVSLDRTRAAAGCLDVWVVRHVNAAGAVTYHSAREINVLMYTGNLTSPFKGSKDAPLTPTGPAYWFETTASLELIS